MRPTIAVAVTLPACSSPSAPLSVVIASPTSATLATNGDVSIDLGVVGAPDTVTLLVDDASVATMSAPYHYVWHTADITEGPHRVVALARAGEREARSIPLLVTVDRTPPTITNRTPPPGHDDVVLHDRITLAFSEPIRTGTVTRTSVALRAGGADVEHTVTLRRDGLSLEITPQTLPPTPAAMTVEWNSLPTDLAGNVLTLPADEWQWTVPPWVVTTSTLRSNDLTGDAHDPAVVSDPNGNITAAFAQADRIVVMHRENGMWAPIGAPLAEPNGGSLGRPSLFALVNGEIYVAARGLAPQGASRILTWRFADNGWESIGAGIEIARGYVADESLGLVVADDGRPVVAWVQHPESGGSNDLRVAFWSCTTWAPFGAHLAADSNSPRVDSPALAMDDTSLVLAWREQASDGGMAVYVRQEVGQSPWRLIGDGLRHSGAVTTVTPPALALDSMGRPVVAFVEGDGAVPTAVHIDRWAADVWAPIASDDARAWIGDARPGYGLDREGRHVLAVMYRDGANDRLGITRYSDTTSRLATLDVDARSAGSFGLVLDPYGSPIVSFEAATATPGAIVVARSNE